MASTTLPQTIPVRRQSEILAALEDGETLIWCGQPKPVGWFRLIKLVLVLFIFLEAFFLFTDHNLADLRRWTLMALFPSALLGLLCAVSLGLGAWDLYMVTNRRAIIFCGTRYFSNKPKSYLPAELHEMSMEEKEDDSGDLVFKRHGTSDGPANYGFMQIQNVREVDRLIREHLQGRHLSD